MLDDGVRDDALLIVLSDSPLANLLDYPRRAAIWPLLPRPAVGKFLATTAEAWNRAFLSAPDEQPPEAILTQEIMRPTHYQPMLARLVACPGRGARYFRTFPGLSETEFSAWLTEIARQNAPLNVEDAEALGGIVAARSWRDAAHQISDIFLDGRSDVRPALAFCLALLGWIRLYQLDMFGTTTPATVKWRTLEEVTIDLYGWGPRDGGIWERAGGKAKDVPKGNTGADVWRKIFADAERGKRIINMRNLITTMASEYPGHETLAKMRYDSFYR
jgi:hypothetical protein